jgi:hypothetical protein
MAPGGGCPPPAGRAAVSEETIELIVFLRKELAGLGLDAGPDTIAWHLHHDHQVAVSPVRGHGQRWPGTG